MLFTSRSGLRGMTVRDGVERVWLRRLTREESVELLYRRCAWTARRGGESGGAGLPLAQRIVAERARRHPEWPLPFFAHVIRPVSRVEVIDTGEERTGAVRVASRLVPRAQPEASGLLRRLSGGQARIVRAVCAARLLSVARTALRSLNGLADVNLIEYTAPDHWELTAACHGYLGSLGGEPPAAAPALVEPPRVVAPTTL
ncbi:hypothetical protein ABZ820_40970 [Streptomyces diacarni]|uniref:hypothetical protein n=1 Tax=Streptomyces diacarni TaxID=2800381 RepID=UPI0033E1ADDC